MNTSKIVILDNSLPKSRIIAENFLTAMNAELSNPIGIDWLDKILSKANIITIGDGENNIEGWLVLYCNDYSSQIAYVAGLHILKSYRGQGQSKLLLSKAIEQCRKNGMHKLTLFCKTDNSIALALYLNWGFVEEYRALQPQYNNEEYAFLSLTIE